MIVFVFIMSVYDDIVKLPLGKRGSQVRTLVAYLLLLHLCGQPHGYRSFPSWRWPTLTGNIACTAFFGVTTFLITNHWYQKYWKKSYGLVSNMVEGACSVIPIHQAFRNLLKPLADYPTLRQYDGESRYRSCVCGYYFHYVSASVKI